MGTQTQSCRLRKKRQLAIGPSCLTLKTVGTNGKKTSYGSMTGRTIGDPSSGVNGIFDTLEPPPSPKPQDLQTATDQSFTGSNPIRLAPLCLHSLILICQCLLHALANSMVKSNLTQGVVLSPKPRDSSRPKHQSRSPIQGSSFSIDPSDSGRDTPSNTRALRKCTFAARPKTCPP
jgi:hypothetical protein